MEQNQEQNRQQNVFRCSGDCINCRKQPGERREQWQYCAAQFTYNSMKILGDMQEQMMAMQNTIEKLSDKIEAIQNCEASVFDPTTNNMEEEDGKPVVETKETVKNTARSSTAQKGDGALQ